ncbi:hypothetical protein KAI46_05125 [bacterium]|nr:hypothetical protein [bacterium]
MEISSAATSTTALAASAQQIQESMKVQVAMLKEMAEIQQQVALMLAESGVGQNLNVLA